MINIGCFRGTKSISRLLDSYYYNADVAFATCKVCFVYKDTSEFLGISTLRQNFFDVFVM